MESKRRIGLSVFLVFHLFALVLAPNSQTYLGGRWGFFAPDPGPPPVFIEYEVAGDNGVGLRTDTWPPRKDPYFLRERFNRQLSVVRFLMNSPEKTEKVMGAYFCKTNPDARSVRIWHVMETIPGLQDVAEKKRAIGDGLDTKRKFVAQVLCEVRA
jgi:hypothetical protein